MDKLVVVISQKGHSYRVFFCRGRDNTNWTKLVKNIEDYKRGYEAEGYLGDFCRKFDYSCRFNVNDASGDIYVIPIESINQGIERVKEYIRGTGFIPRGKVDELHKSKELEKIIGEELDIL